MRKWLLSLLFVPIVASAQKQYFLPTDDPTVDEKEKPMIEVYLPKQEICNEHRANKRVHLVTSRCD